jgi:XTP/dITP diphosphohydrolase
VRVYIATKNPGKLRELTALFAGSTWEPATYDGYRDVVEGDESYAANAALKAEALRAQLLADGVAAAVLGDDSGIEVTALGGRPGVHSARYAGPDATWADRRALLRAELAATGSADRSARFVCALHFIDATGRSTSVEAGVTGTISTEDRGHAGFSYDAAFWYPPLQKTFAELTEEEKNRVSHRARAVTELIATV